MDRAELTHADGQKFTYARDGLGRVSNIYEGTTQTSTARLIQNQFDNRGLIDWIQRATSGSAFNADFSFDPVGRLSSISNDATGTANDLTIGQSYTPASQIASQTRSNDSYSWTGAVAVNRAYTTNGLNQYTAAGPASFTYDANGNLTSDGSTSFTYDIENRLVSASGAKTASLVYDPMGRLWQVTGAATNTRFLYDGDELVAEYDFAGTLARRYVHSDNVDDPVVQYDGAAVGAAARTFLMPDERGSIAGMFYNDGTGRAKNSYDEYGIPGSANQGRFQYTGQIWLPELGMYHYKARLYSPTLGRFLQVDPIGYEDQINLYAYVGNDPVNLHDPEGQVARVVVSGGKWAWRAYRYSGNIGRATRETVKELSTDWHALDSDATTSTWDKLKASTDLILGTELYNESDPGKREKAKDRRARQQEEQRQSRATKQGGESDNRGTPPANNQAQNKQFDSIVKELNLSAEQADQLHREISGQGLGREDILERAKDLFK